MTQVSGGTISLKGRLASCWYFYEYEGVGGKVENLGIYTSNGEQILSGTAYCDVQPPEDPLVRDLYCIPISIQKVLRDMVDTGDLEATYCLLLQYDQEARAFTKFGTFRSGHLDKNENDGTDLLRDACDFFDTSIRRKYWEYDETDKGKKYTITII